jgi:hypothetical protein
MFNHKALARESLNSKRVNHIINRRSIKINRGEQIAVVCNVSFNQTTSWERSIFDSKKLRVIKSQKINVELAFCNQKSYAKNRKNNKFVE